MNAEYPEINADDIPETETAVALRPTGAVGAALPAEQIKAPMTSAQAKVNAIADLTMSAYQKAGTLKLTPEEIAALQADFPDEAFKPGAAGKEHLIYIEHAFLRERFNQVIGLGQWSLIARSRWAEEFTTRGGPNRPPTAGSRVYVEAMLVVRGCFVGEAIGEMEYYPSNASQNYGDAVEGAKTAAFRRCAKEFGVGLQAWKKDFGDGWWARRRAATSKQPQAAPVRRETQSPAPSRPAAPAPKSPQERPFPTEESRTKMISALMAGEGQPNRELVTEYFQKLNQLMPNETIEDLGLRFVPSLTSEMRMLHTRLSQFGSGEQAEPAFEPHTEVFAKGKKKSTAESVQGVQPEKPIEVPRENLPDDGTEEEWRSFLMPWGKEEGVPLEDLDKKYLYGLWANYEVEEEYNGRPKKPETIEKDRLFRQMLDQAGEHYQFTKD